MKNTLYYTFPVPHNVFEEEKFRKYRASIKLVYVWLLKLHNHFANTEGWFFRSSEIISQEIGMDEKTFRSAKKQLHADGYIDIKPGKYNPEKNIRHAFWYKVNGFMNKGEQTHKDNQQDNIPGMVKGNVTKDAIEKKFPEQKGIFEWLIDSNCLEQDVR